MVSVAPKGTVTPLAQMTYGDPLAFHVEVARFPHTLVLAVRVARRCAACWGALSAPAMPSPTTKPQKTSRRASRPRPLEFPPFAPLRNRRSAVIGPPCLGHTTLPRADGCCFGP